MHLFAFVWDGIEISCRMRVEVTRKWPQKIEPLIYCCAVQAYYETLTVCFNADDSGAIGLGGKINILPSRGGAERWMNSVVVGSLAEA
jgi:hypothetical protein